MPKLEDAPTPGPLRESPPSTGRWSGFGLMGLERVTAREAQHALLATAEAPLLGTPTGFGEWLPVLPNEPCPETVAVIRAADELTFP